MSHVLFQFFDSKIHYIWRFFEFRCILHRMDCHRMDCRTEGPIYYDEYYLKGASHPKASNGQRFPCPTPLYWPRL